MVDVRLRCDSCLTQLVLHLDDMHLLHCKDDEGLSRLGFTCPSCGPTLNTLHRHELRGRRRVSASVFDMRSRNSDEAKADEYDRDAEQCTAQARDLTHMADELVTEAMTLHDSSPRRRALLQAAQGLRLAANGFSDAGLEYGEWARSLRESRL